MLEARPDVRTFKVDHTLARNMAQLRFCTPVLRTPAATVSRPGVEVAVCFPPQAAPLMRHAAAGWRPPLAPRKHNLCKLGYTQVTACKQIC